MGSSMSSGTDELIGWLAFPHESSAHLHPSVPIHPCISTCCIFTPSSSEVCHVTQHALTLSPVTFSRYNRARGKASDAMVIIGTRRIRLHSI